MKVTFVYPSTDDVVGGIEVFVNEMARTLSKKHDVVVICGRPRGEKVDRGDATTLHLPYLRRDSIITKIGTLPPTRRLWLPLDFESVSLYLSFLLNRESKRRVKVSDVIVTFYPTDSILFSRYAARRDIPSLYHCNGWGWPRLLAWKRFFRHDRSSVCVAVSETTKKEIERRVNKQLDGIVALMVPEEFYNVESDNPASKTVLFTGRIIAHKGVFNILKIFRELTKKYSLKLIFIGDGDALPALRSKASEYGLKNVKFTGQIPHHQITKYFKGAQLFLAPSEYESGFTSIIEAMAAGVPVIASDIPAAQEVAGGAAVLLSRDDLSNWISAAEKLLNDDGHRGEVIERQRQRAEKYRYSASVKEFESYLKEAVSRGPRRS